jgi:long-chain acyl-CoA synthetase
VFGLPHDTWGEEVAAVIRMAPGHSHEAGEVAAFCKERLAGFKVPAHVVFTDEPLERNALQKLLKAQIRERYFG